MVLTRGKCEDKTFDHRKWGKGRIHEREQKKKGGEDQEAVGIVHMFRERNTR